MGAPLGCRRGAAPCRRVRQVLEELAERDLSEVIPMLVEKIKMWEKRKAMQIVLQKAARRFLCRTHFKRARKAARVIQHRRRACPTRAMCPGAA